MNVRANMHYYGPAKHMTSRPQVDMMRNGSEQYKRRSSGPPSIQTDEVVTMTGNSAGCRWSETCRTYAEVALRTTTVTRREAQDDRESHHRPPNQRRHDGAYNDAVWRDVSTWNTPTQRKPAAHRAFVVTSVTVGTVGQNGAEEAWATTNTANGRETPPSLPMSTTRLAPPSKGKERNLANRVTEYSNLTRRAGRKVRPRSKSLMPAPPTT